MLGFVAGDTGCRVEGSVRLKRAGDHRAKAQVYVSIFTRR